MWPGRRRRTGRPVIAELTVRGRRFRVTCEHDSDSLLVGHVHPRRPHQEITEVSLFGSPVRMTAETSMRFKVWPTNDPEVAHGYVTNIEVVPSKQRRGWATSMLHVLFELYPTCIWTVESPNEQSGQLFERLAKQFPDRVLPPVADETRPVHDPDRYSTRIR
jgi:hypothetical protein